MMNREHKLKEVELVTGNGDLFMNHWFQERKKESKKRKRNRMPLIKLAEL